MTTMAASWMKPLDATLHSGPAAADPEAEVLRLLGDQGSSLYRFCRMTLGGADEADDVVQETFLKLLQHLRAGGDRANLRSWLFTVAANACRDRLRSRRRWLPWRAELDHRTVETAEDTPDRRLALDAARGLPPRDRLLLSLRAQGLSYRDIGIAAGIQEGSVGRLLARAVDRWKRRLEAAQGLRPASRRQP
ncbi:MAG TPA: RNA polymerase sigma factor [Vicinamibacterales bacterium]|nr:RNA polymerase sigma factor [Vicinamibacterales bacterium]